MATTRFGGADPVNRSTVIGWTIGKLHVNLETTIVFYNYNRCIANLGT